VCCLELEFADHISGLGTGSAPKSFIKHGINTTIVELDPVVHEYATKYFELPTNHTAHLSDAVPWVADMSKAQPESFDFIVHDVFTGGAEPTALFTLEFLQGLYNLLKEDGSIAIVCITSPYERS
jgi:spermidine synthase